MINLIELNRLNKELTRKCAFLSDSLGLALDENKRLRGLLYQSMWCLQCYRQQDVERARVSPYGFMVAYCDHCNASRIWTDKNFHLHKSG